MEYRKAYHHLFDYLEMWGHHEAALELKKLEVEDLLHIYQCKADIQSELYGFQASESLANEIAKQVIHNSVWEDLYEHFNEIKPILPEEETKNEWFHRWDFEPVKDSMEIKMRVNLGIRI